MPPKKKQSPPEGYLEFPVRLKQDQNQQPCIVYFSGEIDDNNHVILSEPGDMALCYTMGFYGKGSLSKHEPIFHSVLEQSKDTIVNHLTGASDKRYIYSEKSFMGNEDSREQMSAASIAEHLKYNLSLSKSNQIKANKGAECEISHDSMELETETCTWRKDNPVEDCKTDVELESSHPESNCQPQQGLDVYENVTVAAADDEYSSLQKYKASTATETVEADSWEQGDADEDFWASDKLPEYVLVPEERIVVPQQDTDVPQVLYQPAEDEMGSNPVMNSYYELGKPDVTQLDYEEENLNSSDEEYDYSNLNMAIDDLHIHDGSKVMEGKEEYMKMKETLVLDPYEAVFLILSFGCLVIKDGNNKLVTLEEMWKRCMKSVENFLPKYAVYHHLRAKRQVVKNGLHYGCDFMVYKAGPKYYHASYGVIVRCLSESRLEELDDYNARQLTWPRLMGLNRVIHNVRKKLMICYVILPDHLLTKDLDSPRDVLKQLSICETVLSRKVPTQERTKAT